MQVHRVPPKPKHYDTAPPGTCRWCAEPTYLKSGKPARSRWHAECVTEYRLIYWPGDTRKAVWARDKGKCAHPGCKVKCARKGAPIWHMDHIIPLVEGDGSLFFWSLANLQTLCHEHHKEKTSREATERAERRKTNKQLLLG